MSFIKNMDFEERKNFRTAIISIVMMVAIFVGEVWLYNKLNLLDYTWKMTGKNSLMTVTTTIVMGLMGLVAAYIYGSIPSGWRISKDKMPRFDGWIVIMPIIHWLIVGYLKFALRIILSIFWGVISFPGFLLGSKFPKLKSKKLCGVCTLVVLAIFSMFVGAFDHFTEKAGVLNEEKLHINYEKQVEMDNYFTEK